MKSIIASVLALAGLTTPGVAQDFPTQTVRTVISMGVGGTADVFMRVLGEELQKRWGQPVVVENRPGGNFTIGARACAQAPRDGHTLCLMPGEPVVYNPFLLSNMGYDPEKDFEPITLAFFGPQALVVSAKLGPKSLAELAEFSKARPGTLSFFSASISLQVFMERWKKSTGADMVWVAAKSGADAVNGVLAGSTPIAFYGVANFMSLIEAGSVLPLAIDSAKRLSILPNTPTLIELGYTERLPRVFFGLFVPKGTPKAIVDKLHRDIVAIGSAPEFAKRRLVDLGQEPVFNTPEAFASFLKEERVISERVIKEAGLKPN